MIVFTSCTHASLKHYKIMMVQFSSQFGTLTMKNSGKACQKMMKRQVCATKLHFPIQSFSVATLEQLKFKFIHK